LSARVLCGPARLVQRQIARRLGDAGIAEAMLEARLLVAHALGCGALDLLADRALSIDGAAAERLAGLVKRRLAHEPIAYLLGEREFWSLALTVTPDVLIPRPDSETLIEAALLALPKRDEPLRILDLGTGSGCLLLALLSEWPAARGVGVDISEPALRVARFNAARLGLDHRAAFVCSDWDSALGTERFDIVVSNPPYISEAEMAALAPDVRAFEPHLALTAGDDGLAAYRRVLPACRRRLADGGRAFIEIAAARLAGVTALIAVAGLQRVDVKHDLSGVPRCLVLRR
jgi:release factor glutamine methyltransferase